MRREISADPGPGTKIISDIILISGHYMNREDWGTFSEHFEKLVRGPCQGAIGLLKSFLVRWKAEVSYF